LLAIAVIGYLAYEQIMRYWVKA
jgi:regulator of protease activity HflC (stomatin/prohibitin superfamily)